jgi:hypothetical protein
MDECPGCGREIAVERFYCHRCQKSYCTECINNHSHSKVTKPKKMAHWSTVLDIIQHGIDGDQEKVKAYAGLLLEKLQENDDEVPARYLKDLLDEKPRGAIITPA